MNDEVQHPSHYTQGPECPKCGSTIEAITVTERLGFNLGNAVKYIWRAGLKDKAKHATDLEKANWYVNRQILWLKSCLEPSRNVIKRLAGALARKVIVNKIDELGKASLALYEEIKAVRGENTFVHRWNELTNAIHTTALEKGWWPTNPEERNAGEALALMHSELSEALEADRKSLKSEHLKGYSGVEEELADVVIRIMDYAAGKNLRVAEAVVAKAEYNKGRAFKHGGKKY